MTPQAFLAKWRDAADEHAVAQPHFVDLCRLLGVDDPQTADPAREWFCFERGAKKAGGGSGWADVWRRGCFGWEYKSRGRNLDEAHAQLLRYAGALESPPLLITCDFARYRIHTNWTNTVAETHAFAHDDLADAAVRDRLAWAFTDPERLKPAKTRQQVTEDAAARFVALADRLRARGHDPQAVAHFVNRLVFCMFAEHVGLLRGRMFQKMLDACAGDPERFRPYAAELFAAMRSGGRVGYDVVDWFNGGLFDDDAALPVTRDDLADLRAAARLDWSEIDPSILGTLFERGLDPGKRAQLGAHYTDRDKIMLILDPVLVRPLTAEWEVAKAGMLDAAEREREARAKAARTPNPAASGVETKRANAARAEAEALHARFVERLRAFRVLDPACGSGNFLYLALRALKDIEHRANVDAAAILDAAVGFPAVGPECVLGIEINPFAAELARVSVWIGEIQWMRRHGFDAARNPILRPLDTIECRDAILTPEGARAAWPAAEAIVGNPPFLGGKMMRDGLGDAYVDALFAAYRGAVRPESDLVTYWFALAGEALRVGRARRVGLVSTNSIRGGANRATLASAVEGGRIFDAWADEEWTVEGAAVRVSLVCFSHEAEVGARLDGRAVADVYTDLTAANIGRAAVDLTKAVALRENRGVAFQGPVKVGPFDVDGETARHWLKLPTNPNGLKNCTVLFPLLNGTDITRRDSGRWIINFGEMPQADAVLFEAPFEHVRAEVKPLRDQNRDRQRRENWWRLGRSGSELNAATGSLERAILTPRVSKHRIFIWAAPQVLPDSAVVAIARDDDTTFGVLHSRFHELWSLRMGTWLGVGNDPRYTPSTTFETFPFPEGLTPDRPAAAYADDPHARRIAEAAERLNALREAWLNPPDLVRREPEVVPGFPDRLLPVSPAAAAELKKRTLTNLYNVRPAWLDHAHLALDEAVADAYGWGDDWRAGRLADDEILTRLFRLNQERAAQGR